MVKKRDDLLPSRSGEGSTKAYIEYKASNTRTCLFVLFSALLGYRIGQRIFVVSRNGNEHNWKPSCWRSIHTKFTRHTFD